MVSDHTRWLISDGRSIDVTRNPWVHGLPLRLWPTTVSVEAGEGLYVYDLMSPGEAGWDEIRLARFFGEHLAERVRSLSLPRSGGPDIRVWSSSTSPRVRMGDLSRILRRKYEPGLDCAWIWRLGLLPRVALFLEGGLGPASYESCTWRTRSEDPIGVWGVQCGRDGRPCPVPVHMGKGYLAPGRGPSVGLEL